MLLLVLTPKLISYFVEGITADFSFTGPCVESEGCSLDGWEEVRLPSAVPSNKPQDTRNRPQVALGEVKVGC